MHILIIEDEYTLAELIKEKLTKDDYIVDIEIDITKSVLKNTNNNEEVELVCKELKWL